MKTTKKIIISFAICTIFTVSAHYLDFPDVDFTLGWVGGILCMAVLRD